MTPDQLDPTLVVGLAALVTALVQLAKAMRMPDALAPLANLVLGVAAAAIWVSEPWRTVAMAGLVIGLTAGGFYSGVTSTRSAIHTAQARRASTISRDRT